MKLGPGHNYKKGRAAIRHCLAYRLNSVLNVKAVVAAFNQEKVLVGAFSVIVELRRLIVYSTSRRPRLRPAAAQLL